MLKGRIRLLGYPHSMKAPQVERKGDFLTNEQNDGLAHSMGQTDLIQDIG